MKLDFVVASLLVTVAVAQHAPELEPVAFVVGSFEGDVKHPWGTLQETLTGEWSLGGTTIVVRSRSKFDGQTVFEDLRVFSFDPEREVIRMRQWALGDLSVYDVEVLDDRVVCRETAHEGKNRQEWRYTMTRSADGYRYRVDARRGEEFAEYVSGELRRALAPTSEPGEFARTSRRTQLAGLDAELWLPAGAGPFPGLVFSPGGQAAAVDGYAPFGRWFASWGFAVAIVAFDTDDAESRAPLFEKVTAALPESFDRTRLVAAGHSRGAVAAVLASRAASKTFKACIAIAPPGPTAAPDGPATLVVIGGADRFLPKANALFETLAAPSYLIELDGMDHMLAPPERGDQVLARATAFLLAHVAGDARYLEPLTAIEPGVRIETRPE